MTAMRSFLAHCCAQNDMNVQWQFLKNAIINKRVPQALIFSGPEGTGKKQTALEFVKLLHGGAVHKQDFIYIEPATNPESSAKNPKVEIWIEKMQGLRKDLSYRPQFAELKAVLIEKAHLMNQQAQNCFLKTLEEPPGKTVFMLLTAFPEILLPTIRSRCAKLKFFLKEQPGLERKQEIESLLKQDLAGKFALVEQISKKESKPEIQMFLQDLIKYLRELMLEKLKREASIDYSFSYLKEAINQAENLKLLLSTTNISQRLALEALMLNL